MTLNEFLAKAGQLLGMAEKGAKAQSGDLADANQKISALEGDKSKLAEGATLPTDLVTAANQVAAITKERDDALQKNSALEGDKSKLAQGATLPADLVTAANQIATVTKERDDAKATLADPKGAIQTAASHKAADITAAQGQPPVAVVPVATPAAKTNPAAGLTGLDRAIAAHKAKYEAKAAKA